MYNHFKMANWFGGNIGNLGNSLDAIRNRDQTRLKSPFEFSFTFRSSKLSKLVK